MAMRPACCEPCQGLGYCRPQRNCCLECHFAFEESYALPHLPPAWQERLRREHAWLEANGFPPEAVAAHAEWEEAAFRAFCPAWLCELFESDHKAHGHGQLHSRVEFPMRNQRYSPVWAAASGV